MSQTPSAVAQRIFGDLANNVGWRASRQVTRYHVIGQFLYEPPIPCVDDFNLLAANMEKCTTVQIEPEFDRSAHLSDSCMANHGARRYRASGPQGLSRRCSTALKRATPRLSSCGRNPRRRRRYRRGLPAHRASRIDPAEALREN